MNTTIPDWQTSFRDFPEIHYSKKWQKGKKRTLEHDISFKLMAKEKLDASEVQILSELLEFYNKFDEKISVFDFSTLKSSDLLNFRNYIIYVFNFFVELTNEINFHEVYRIVNNESIIGSKKSLTQISQLAYPPSEIVKKINKYNRGNTPDFPIFYCSETMNTAIYELNPNIGDLVTIGVWRPANKMPFKSFPITHNDEALYKNETTTLGRKAIENFKTNNDKLLTSYIESYLKLLGRQYSKKIRHHYEYMISAIISEKLLENPKISKIPNDIDCIVYPSVENKYNSNLAFRTDVVDDRLNLFCALEFKVLEKHFNRKPSSRINSINLVKAGDLKMTLKFEKNQIVW